MCLDTPKIYRHDVNEHAIALFQSAIANMGLGFVHGYVEHGHRNRVSGIYFSDAQDGDTLCVSVGSLIVLYTMKRWVWVPSA